MHPLQGICARWLEKIRKGLEFKNKRFGKDAEEGMKFFNGPYDWLYDSKGSRQDRHFRVSDGDEGDENEIPNPQFLMTVNKVAELVQIFGPFLYHKNPHRQVNPRESFAPDDNLLLAFGGTPQSLMYLNALGQQTAMQQAMDVSRGRLLEGYLNYTPNALDLKTESRWAIDEGIIKGEGCLWTELYTTPIGYKMVGTFFDSVDNLVKDPDMPTTRSAKWIARRRTMPVWEAERKFNLPPGTLRAQMESLNQQATVEAHQDGSYLRATGQTNDLIVFFEVYSKCGIGGRLVGTDKAQQPWFDRFGDYCYLAVAEGVPYPLNVPSQLWDLPEGQGFAAIMQRIQWQSPYWADDDWPYTSIHFHDIPNDPWPMSHIAPGLGELKFLNWVYSFLAGKIRITCRDFIAVLKSAGEEIKAAIHKGTDLEIIEISESHGKTIQEIVQFLQHPEFNGDIWKVIQAIADQFEKRVGLTELMYGESSRQMRSAAEAEIKEGQISVRPDDMANKIEDAMSAVARKEAIAIRWHLKGQDIAPCLGPTAAAIWDMIITPADPRSIFYSHDYRIESGSIRKPNRQRDAANVQDTNQMLLPSFIGLAQAGVVGPYNALITQWGKTIDMDISGFLLQAPPPMPAPAAGGEGEGQQQQAA